jgi:hypothetical protein
VCCNVLSLSRSGPYTLTDSAAPYSPTFCSPSVDHHLTYQLSCLCFVKLLRNRSFLHSLLVASFLNPRNASLPSLQFLRDDDDADALQNHFPDGEHPLEGVPNFKELSAPEGLKGKSRYAPFRHGFQNTYEMLCRSIPSWIPKYV